MAHERDDSGVAVDPLPAGLAGAAASAPYQSGPFVAAFHAEGRQPFPRCAQLFFPFLCKGQPELFHLTDKVVINRETVFRVLPERGIPDRGEILVLQQQRHAAPPPFFLLWLKISRIL